MMKRRHYRKKTWSEPEGYAAGAAAINLDCVTSRLLRGAA